jgi:L-methionine (R)-S-oxide reductase
MHFMWHIQTGKYEKNREDYYRDLKNDLASLIAGETSFVANMANIASWIYHTMPHLNWAGFYLCEYAPQEELVLGPFQGLPACIRIKKGKGVCGSAWAEQQYQLVTDVHAFPGHIACDAVTRSELVLPLFNEEGKIWGVFDLDSPRLARFDSLDAKELSHIFQSLQLSPSRAL